MSGVDKAVVVHAAIQKQCEDHAFQAGAELVKEVLTEHMATDDGCDALPVFSNLVCVANR
jgi:hypothetical protein